MIEVVSPGNKDSKHALASFVAKAVDFTPTILTRLRLRPTRCKENGSGRA
jgi:hypothetical protein